MIVTERDIRLVRDIALSHVLSRDQILSLYFGSVTRANTRLRELAKIQLVRRLETPFFSQSLYTTGRRAEEVVGNRIAPLLRRRLDSPRFLQHALSVTNARIELTRRFEGEWRFEQQSRATFIHQKAWDVRPDGVLLTRNVPILLEVDMGHVGAPSFLLKLKGYRAYLQSGKFERTYACKTFRLLTLTKGTARAHRLSRLLPPESAFEFVVQTFDELGIPTIGGWS